MPDTHSAKNGAEVLLEQLESHEVDCVFASSIAVMAPIWEALARRGNDMKLRYFGCRHEHLAVSLASGYILEQEPLLNNVLRGFKTLRVAVN